MLVIAEHTAPATKPAPSATDLRADLAALDKHLGNLTDAIAEGNGAMPLLVRKMQDAKRRDAVAALLVPVPAAPQLEHTALRRELEARISDRQAILRRNMPQGRQLLRKLFVARPRFTRAPEGVRFEGYVTRARAEVVYGLALDAAGAVDAAATVRRRADLCV